MANTNRTFRCFQLNGSRGREANQGKTTFATHKLSFFEGNRWIEFRRVPVRAIFQQIFEENEISQLPRDVRMFSAFARLSCMYSAGIE